jgi:hypothetical protein
MDTFWYIYIRYFFGEAAPDGLKERCQTLILLAGTRADIFSERV